MKRNAYGDLVHVFAIVYARVIIKTNNAGRHQRAELVANGLPDRDGLLFGSQCI